MTTQPPPVDPRDITPGRVWYWIAGIIMVLGIGAGVGVFAFGVSSIVGNLPAMEKRFAAGETTTVELSGGDWAVYVDAPGDSAPLVECSTETPDSDLLMAPSDDDFSFGEGGEQWHLVYDLTVAESGEYTLTCTSDEAVGDFAIGESVDVGGFVGGIFGSIGGLVGIPCFGLVVGGVIILVVAMRRSSSKKRLRSKPQAPGAW